MFDVGFSEILVIALIALVVLGPKRLPEAARAAGKWMAKMRRFVSEVRHDFDREMHNAEIMELQKLKQDLTETSGQLMQDIASPPENAIASPSRSARTRAARTKPGRKTAAPAKKSSAGKSLNGAKAKRSR